ncbi:YceI family protein [Chitinophaga qingshengii]|uniref:YceI family protein n=1 Tax=Chitinophaga qingshengii TaxID=1569794 RepID=A0ABR7TUF7_9BACT|nr:YceI family protein [Chitinophaga qingshengii]MBC9933071.1 YceI family protein [Chitinophaga qingshengii]
MKKILYPIAALLILMTAAFTFITTQNWKINKGYSIKFTGKYADGTFESMKGTILFDEKDLATAKFDVQVEVASINTGNGLKNRHARGEKWFDADKYPYIHFVSSEVVKTANGYDAKGTLDMHGIKKPFTIPFTFIHNGDKGSFQGTFKVNRGDFGITTPRGDESDYTELTVTVPVSSK